MTPQLLFPAGSCPPLPAENFCSLTRVFLLPSSSGHGAEEMGPFLSARSTEISKHFLSQTELQRRKLGKAWELYFSLTRKGCSGNILNLPLHFNLFPLVNLSPQNAVTSPKVLPSIKKKLETFFSNALFLKSGDVLELFPTNRFGFDRIFNLFFFLEEWGKNINPITWSRAAVWCHSEEPALEACSFSQRCPHAEHPKYKDQEALTPCSVQPG